MGKAKTEHSHTKSITNRLLWNLFVRQLIFITIINFLVVILAAVSVVVWAEHSASQAVLLVDTYGFPTDESLPWLELSHFEILPLDRPAEGLSFIEYFSDSSRSATGLRNYTSFFRYRVEFDQVPVPYAVSVNLQDILGLIHFAFLFLLFIEMIFLCSTPFVNNRFVHRTLKPIHDLAATTVLLNQVEGFSDREMVALAGELDKINATHLDSRISVSTTQKELQTLAFAINSMLDRVADAYSAQMRFVSDASHELRTPIAVIQGYSSMLNRWGKSNPDTLQESIDAIREEAKSMERLIEQLLFLARGDNASQPFHKEDFDLSSIAAAVLREEGMLFPQHELIPVWDGDYPFQGDPALLKQLLRILVDNSLKYTSAQDRVWLILDQTDTLVTLTIEDEGMGIAPESLPLIFERFYRTDSSRTRQTGGTGLGLSIAHWIVHQHKGWFQICSREGIGTRITISFPKDSTLSETES